ncbi:hypothetical protein BS47DRAFT_1402855 [Hydnum rufescens UP504]|uniref:Uncharacterized protein n=1 Tax=Hydnum rufescens UP504 TaxID=1448309 RepID=A0A9P6DLF2_9AGAM|nr:hypothetical protein BS47DRAFT_1402855 [Hydnum rufescens UP504]
MASPSKRTHNLFELKAVYGSVPAQTSFPIVDWCEYIDSACLDPHRIVAIFRRKESIGIRHEYILLKACRDIDGAELWLRLDWAGLFSWRSIPTLSAPIYDLVTIAALDRPLSSGAPSNLSTHFEFDHGPTLYDLSRLLFIITGQVTLYKLHKPLHLRAQPLHIANLSWRIKRLTVYPGPSAMRPPDHGEPQHTVDLMPLGDL